MKYFAGLDVSLEETSILHCRRDWPDREGGESVERSAGVV